MIERECISIARQNKVKSFLNFLRMSKSVLKKWILLSGWKESTNSMRCQRNKLHRYTVETRTRLSTFQLLLQGKCATDPLARVATSDLNFQQLYGELESQHQLRREAETARPKEEIFSRNRNVTSTVKRPFLGFC